MHVWALCLSSCEVVSTSHLMQLSMSLTHRASQEMSIKQPSKPPDILRHNHHCVTLQHLRPPNLKCTRYGKLRDRLKIWHSPTQLCIHVHHAYDAYSPQAPTPSCSGRATQPRIDRLAHMAQLTRLMNPGMRVCADL